MAQIKAHEFERFVASGKMPYRVFLFYGPDRGLVSERAKALAEKTGIDLTDDFSVVRLDADDLRSDPGRLADEANSIALFGGDRLVWLRGAGNDRALATVLADLGNDPPQSAIVIIEAGELKKGSAVRKAVEEARGALAVPCYADEGRGIQALIDDELGRSGLRITPDARERLASSLGGDRLASRAELQKLALYCLGNETITEDDVVAVVGDAAGASVDDAVDAVLRGNLAAFDQAMQRITASKTPVFMVLLATLRQFQMLEMLACEMRESRRGPSQVLAAHGRAIHFRRKPAVEYALSNWSAPALTQALDHFQRAILESRRQPRLEDDIARHALIAVALRSARRPVS